MIYGRVVGGEGGYTTIVLDIRAKKGRERA
jgi:hypothetical protein